MNTNQLEILSQMKNVECALQEIFKDIVSFNMGNAQFNSETSPELAVLTDNIEKISKKIHKVVYQD